MNHMDETKPIGFSAPQNQPSKIVLHSGGNQMKLVPLPCPARVVSLMPHANSAACIPAIIVHRPPSTPCEIAVLIRFGVVSATLHPNRAANFPPTSRLPIPHLDILTTSATPRTVHSRHFLPPFTTPARLSGLQIQVKTPSSSCWAVGSCPSPWFWEIRPSASL
jgi:hypothetical protein